MKKLLVPVDGSECSWKAVKTARLFAEAVPAEITVVCNPGSEYVSCLRARPYLREESV